MTIDTGVIHRDDNIDRLPQIAGASVDLVYLDPPFFSNRLYEVIWGDEAEVRSFEDRWSGGIQKYVDWMRPRVEELHRILKPSGSIYLHCDWHASHYLKIMMDDIFGQQQFRNEIAWHYSGWNKRLADHFERRHDNILFYGRSKKQKFNGCALPWASKEEYVRVRKQKLYTEPDGQEYVMSDAGGGTRVRRYIADAMQYGRPVDDVWNIDKLNNSAREGLGYPTQKPEALLARIIEASSDKDDVVLDPFCGCGTTLAVAEQMKRRWVGIDISPTAVRIMRRRLLKLGCRPVVTNPVDSLQALRDLKPFEFQNWIIQSIHGEHSPRKVGDMGIDGFWFLTREPIQVKQSEHVGRNVVDNFETAIRRAGHTGGYIIAFSFTKGAVEETVRAKSEGLDIRLIKVAEVLMLVTRPGVSKAFGPLPDDDEEAAIVPLRSPKAMPTVQELAENNRKAVGI